MPPTDRHQAIDYFAIYICKRHNTGKTKTGAGGCVLGVFRSIGRSSFEAIARAVVADIEKIYTKLG